LIVYLGRNRTPDRYYLTPEGSMLLYTSYCVLSIVLENILKDLTKLVYDYILIHMAILPSIDNNTRKRELTEKQQSFLNHLVETQGDAKEAAKLAGYSSHYHHVVKTLKSEILELTQEVLANSAPKAAFKLVEIMDSKRPIIQANNKLAAATTLLDRVGVSKVDRVDVNHNVQSGGIFLMPDKKPLDLEEADYEDISD
tara:strand:- start:345 stop:938 length:594 start_codon:yes stop_codon:yes gene_type:complete